MLKATLLCSVLLAATAAPAWAQETDAPAGQPFVFEAGTFEVVDLVEDAAARLGRNFLVNEQELRNAGVGTASITLQNRIVTDRDGYEDVLTQLLYTKGFVILTRDAEKQLYEVISLNGVRAREVGSAQEHKSPEAILARPNLVVPVMTVVELEHVNAMIANNSLRPFFSSTGGNNFGGVTIGTPGNESSMMISGMQNVVANTIRMVRNCDVPGGGLNSMQTRDRLQLLEQRIAALEKKLARLMGEDEDKDGK